MRVWPCFKGFVKAVQISFGGGPPLPPLDETSNASVGTISSSSGKRKLHTMNAVSNKQSKYESIIAANYSTINPFEQSTNSYAVYSEAHFHSYEITAAKDKLEAEN